MSHLLAAIEHERPPKAAGTFPLLDMPNTSHNNIPSDLVVDNVSQHGNSVRSLPTVESESASALLPKGRTIIVIASLAGVNFLSSLSNGLVTVGLPRMAGDIQLPAHLLLW